MTQATFTLVAGVVEVALPGPPGPTGPAGPAGSAGEGVPAGGTAGQVLAKVDGDDYNTEWLDAGGVGTVTSVDVSVPTGFASSGGPVTAAGTVALAYDTGYQGFLSADKTKLDGIEAGADVTDTANVTAAGALMDSEVTNLADVKAFDPANYATAAQGSLADSAVQPGDDADTLGSGVATDGWVLTADGVGGAAWEAATGGGASALDDLSDVTITTPANDQVLKYSSGQWINAAAPGGGGGTVSSVGLVAPTGLTVSGSPVTTSGDLTLAYDTGYQGFLSSDKTKLDGIEAGADVTDTANVTAAGALMDSEVTNLADVKAFDPTNYATSAQGGLADSAVQPGDLATVATTGSYSDLSGTPTLGTAAAAATTDFAPASEGVTNGNSHNHDGGDGAQIAYSSLSGLPTLGTAAATASTDYATAAQGTDAREWTATTIAQAEAEAGTATTRRAFTAERVRQAIVAWWATISSTIATLTGTQTLTNKTLGDLKETVYTVSDGASVDLDPADGPIQVWTLGADRTTTATSFAAGQSMMLMIADGTAFTITWTTMAVVWVGGSAPTLATSGYTVVELWKVNSTIYGATVGDVA